MGHFNFFFNLSVSIWHCLCSIFQSDDLQHAWATLHLLQHIELNSNTRNAVPLWNVQMSKRKHPLSVIYIHYHILISQRKSRKWCPRLYFPLCSPTSHILSDQMRINCRVFILWQKEVFGETTAKQQFTSSLIYQLWKKLNYMLLRNPIYAVSSIVYEPFVATVTKKALKDHSGLL